LHRATGEENQKLKQNQYLKTKAGNRVVICCPLNP